MPKNPEQDFENQVNQGEGNKAAAREYNDKATEHAKSGKVDREAKDAKRAVDTEGEDLKRAEEVGKERMAEEDPEFRK
jgi:hypothetical protein